MTALAMTMEEAEKSRWNLCIRQQQESTISNH